MIEYSSFNRITLNYFVVLNEYPRIQIFLTSLLKTQSQWHIMHWNVLLKTKSWRKHHISKW